MAWLPTATTGDGTPSRAAPRAAAPRPAAAANRAAPMALERVNREYLLTGLFRCGAAQGLVVRLTAVRTGTPSRRPDAPPSFSPTNEGLSVHACDQALHIDPHR